MPALLPDGLDDFIRLVLPELRRRGLFRTEYEGATLRENLGLRRPVSRYQREATVFPRPFVNHVLTTTSPLTTPVCLQRR